ncbi:hypothetical protein E2562_001262 [Oryza meyeriana var. granulata]|uniref:Uncharacterized protein n=1 Tax=Oryza meyeriana var. granulata TaxID=110450 RepID=A0A6G1DC51_9ORYZ|nr:hypothetical protein E2562_001262 [Oryza meyeriana var. granulata]
MAVVVAKSESAVLPPSPAPQSRAGLLLPPLPHAGLPLPRALSSSVLSSLVPEIRNALGVRSPVPSFSLWASKSGNDLWIATRPRFEQRASS